MAVNGIPTMHGGNYIAKVIRDQGVRHVFTLCGGHISPILVGCKQWGMAVIDVRDEATAVFAADAMARLTGLPGIAVVTAGPGATNTITAVKNAQSAQSPVVIISGAPATALSGRGALQDIDLISLFKSVVKHTLAPTRVSELLPMLTEAIEISLAGTPGPVFLQCPVDLLYDKSTVEMFYGLNTAHDSANMNPQEIKLRKHVDHLFADVEPSLESRAPISSTPQSTPIGLQSIPPRAEDIERIAQALSHAKQPVLIIGSQSVLSIARIDHLVTYIDALGVPTYLTGMARGLLGKAHRLHLRHQRKAALESADLVVLAGVPCDFRLGYGKIINKDANIISINRNKHDLYLNNNPDIAVLADPAMTLIEVGKSSQPRKNGSSWLALLKSRDEKRNLDMHKLAEEQGEGINPLDLLFRLNQELSPNATIIVDGGDFVATASYILEAPRPLSWLDPGAYGTLGMGAGFALSAKLVQPDSEVWIVFGDGAFGYSLIEFDTFVRHNIPVIAIVGNNAGWCQIARDQVAILNDNVATQLNSTNYHQAVEGLGAKGLLLEDPAKISSTLQHARKLARDGHVVLINARLSQSDFRKGSISI